MDTNKPYATTGTACSSFPTKPGPRATRRCCKSLSPGLVVKTNTKKKRFGKQTSTSSRHTTNTHKKNTVLVETPTYRWPSEKKGKQTCWHVHHTQPKSNRHTTKKYVKLQTGPPLGFSAYYYYCTSSAWRSAGLTPLTGTMNHTDEEVCYTGGSKQCSKAQGNFSGDLSLDDSRPEEPSPKKRTTNRQQSPGTLPINKLRHRIDKPEELATQREQHIDTTQHAIILSYTPLRTTTPACNQQPLLPIEYP